MGGRPRGRSGNFTAWSGRRVHWFEGIADAIRRVFQAPHQELDVGRVVTRTRKHETDASCDAAVAAEHRCSDAHLTGIELAHAHGIAGPAHGLNVLVKRGEAAFSLLRGKLGPMPLE